MIDYRKLVERILMSETESEWVEFKVNNSDPNQIGRYISGVANSVCLVRREQGYVIWGIADDRTLVGTEFKPTSKHKDQPLVFWLTQKLSPKVGFKFHEVEIDGCRVVVLDIPSASQSPVAFDGVRWIRYGSSLVQLNQYPQLESELWDNLRGVTFEEAAAAEGLSVEEVVQLIDLDAYYTQRNLPIPATTGQKITDMLQGRLIQRRADGGIDIPRSTAIVLARQLVAFPCFQKKGVRLVLFDGRESDASYTEYPGSKGYGIGFEGLIDTLRSLLSSEAVRSDTIKRNVEYVYPMVALRELVANALIHQDLSDREVRPIIKIYPDCIEITNPGESLVPLRRAIGAPSRTRNPNTVTLMRNFGHVEELGSGLRRVLEAVEDQLLPAPEIVSENGYTKVTLYSKRDFGRITRAQRIEAAFWHAALHYHKTGQPISNETFRARFHLAKSQASTVTQILKDAVDAELIHPADETVGNRGRKYLPFYVQ